MSSQAEIFDDAFEVDDVLIDFLEVTYTPGELQQIDSLERLYLRKSQGKVFECSKCFLHLSSHQDLTLHKELVHKPRINQPDIISSQGNCIFI